MALEFLKAKVWPETPFLICYDTSEPLEFPFFFFFPHNQFAGQTLILKKGYFGSLPPPLTESTEYFFLRHCKYLYMYSVRG